MKIKKTLHKKPGIEASSMADIAFLLLIFFLVSSVITGNKGLLATVPPAVPPAASTAVEPHNLLNVHVSGDGEWRVNSKPMPGETAKAEIKKFINNKGKLPSLSESPEKAMIVLTGDGHMKFDRYLQALSDLHLIYDELRAEFLGWPLRQYISRKRIAGSEDIPLLNKAAEAYPIHIAEPPAKEDLP